jgi:hypothetical protein
MMLLYALFTELHPYGVAYGSTSLQCELAVREYASAVQQYKARTGRLPLSLEQLVPLYMPEHALCDGDTSGPRPLTPFGIRSTLTDLVTYSPPPQRPDYSLVERPDGKQTFEILCGRPHPNRCGFRGDSGAFTFDMRAEP